MGKVYDFVLRGLNFSKCPHCGNEYPMRKNPKKSHSRRCPKCLTYYESEYLDEESEPETI